MELCRSEACTKPTYDVIWQTSQTTQVD